MNEQQALNYKRIAGAISYIRENFRSQPGLHEVAEKVHLSPFHFQRLFKEWAGTTPKKFLQYTSIQHAKRMLQQRQATLFDTATDTGLSGTGRLLDLFVKIEGMTPAEFKHGGKHLRIAYSFTHTQFGRLLAASTSKGICYMGFAEDAREALRTLHQRFPHAEFQEKRDELQENALSVFRYDRNFPMEIKLHLPGTDFQLKVWEALLKIPMGRLSTYGRIAKEIGSPQASRAVGTAIGSNPVAFIIPCHRVIQSTGHFGGYMWGSTRKTAMIGWESAMTNSADR